MHIPNDTRDQLISGFRNRICDQLDIRPFFHQADWWAASDGAILLGVEDPAGMEIREGDGTIKTYGLAPRRGGRARVLADLGAYKIGKSFSSAIWACGFAAVPGARCQLVGLEYDICEPEFQYICDTLLSERGLGLKYESLQNRPRDGRMWLDMPNGARFEAKSWERKDSMKGKEVDLMLFCEAYMLPGIECYTSFSQNLRARDGYALFATTPDRPWVKELHEKAHSGDDRFIKWHCTCNVHSSANPFTFDREAMDRDRDLMTAEKFAIHYEGKLGGFVGRVFDYQRGSRTFTPATHPFLWEGEEGDSQTPPTKARFRLPAGWELVGGADTGTFAAALLVAFNPDGEVFVLEEFPNYRYVAGTPELDNSSIPSWAANVRYTSEKLGGVKGGWWADPNSQWKKELLNYGIHLLPARAPVETRTEVLREYFAQGKIWLAPWLSVLPFELENAKWPEEATSAGKYARVKDRDHALDPLEHIVARRPRGVAGRETKSAGQWRDQFKKKDRTRNIHLGRQ